jgi:hypothetical protein
MTRQTHPKTHCVSPIASMLRYKHVSLARQNRADLFPPDAVFAGMSTGRNLTMQCEEPCTGLEFAGTCGKMSDGCVKHWSGRRKPLFS